MVISFAYWHMALTESQMSSLFCACTNTFTVTPLICIKKIKKTCWHQTVLIPSTPNTLLFSVSIYLNIWFTGSLLWTCPHTWSKATLHWPPVCYTPLSDFENFFPGHFKVCVTVCVHVLWALGAQLLDVVIADSRVHSPLRSLLCDCSPLTTSHQHCGVCLQERRPSRQVYERRWAGYTLINLTDAWCVITFHLLLFSHSSLYREPL